MDFSQWNFFSLKYYVRNIIKILIIVLIQSNIFENIFLIGHCLAIVLKLVLHLINYFCLVFAILNIFHIWKAHSELDIITQYASNVNSLIQFPSSLQQNVSLYTKWFHWMLNEFISHSEWDLMGK